MKPFVDRTVRGDGARRLAILFCLSFLLLSIPAHAQDAKNALQTLQDAFVQVAQAVRPAVVNVSTTQRPRPQEERQSPQVPPQFRDFFGGDFVFGKLRLIF